MPYAETPFGLQGCKKLAVVATAAQRVHASTAQTEISVEYLLEEPCVTETQRLAYGLQPKLSVHLRVMSWCNASPRITSAGRLREATKRILGGSVEPKIPEQAGQRQRALLSLVPLPTTLDRRV